jgi:hypothetical protein
LDEGSTGRSDITGDDIRNVIPDQVAADGHSDRRRAPRGCRSWHAYGDFYHARGPAAELRNWMLGSRTPEDAYEGIAWLYGGM